MPYHVSTRLAANLCDVLLTKLLHTLVRKKAAFAPAAEKRLSMIKITTSKQTLRTLNNVHRKKAAVEAEDYDVAKALKQDIERLRLAGEASPCGRAPNRQVSGQPGGQRGGAHAHEQVGWSCQGHILPYAATCSSLWERVGCSDHRHLCLGQRWPHQATLSNASDVTK